MHKHGSMKVPAVPYLDGSLHQLSADSSDSLKSYSGYMEVKAPRAALRQRRMTVLFPDERRGKAFDCPNVHVYQFR